MSPELTALKRLRTSFLSSLRVELLEVSDEDWDTELADEVSGASWDSRVVRAVCAAEMSPLESADETLPRNCPSGLLESALEGWSCSTFARYFSALAVSPDWIEEMRSESAFPKAFPDCDEEAVREAVEELERLVKSVTLCKLEIDMIMFLSQRLLKPGPPRLVRIELLFCWLV